MPRSRRRHHSRSRSRSRSLSHDRDRDTKRRKIENYDSPNHKRSVSAEPEEVIILENSIEENEPVKPVEIVNNTKENIEEPEVEVKETKTTEAGDTSISSNSTEGDNNKTDVKKMDVDKTTPHKALTPKQIQRKLESEKKKVERQKERDEKERKKQEEKERLILEKQKQKEEKEKERLKDLEQKRKEKEEKEEQKRKEKEEREEQKRKEKEDKELKRKEKEEREEQKRKEKEQEKLKKQQEQEEKIKEKQKIEEQKQKAAAAFVNFFVTKKVEGSNEDKKCEENKNSLFKDFEVKSDMRLAPLIRKFLSHSEKDLLTDSIKKQINKESSYLLNIKNKKSVGKCGKTFPYEDCQEDTDDVKIIEDETELGETICEDKPKSAKMKAKYLKFHENRRPAYFGTWRKKTNSIKPRKPFNTDPELFNYEEDSDDDWEEEEQGESLDDSDGEEKENEGEKDDYEVDNEFFVPHGHLSDDEVDDEENSKLSPESHKQKLKLLKDEFDEDMKSKTNRIKPRSVGCIWYNKEGNNVDEAIASYLRPLAVITNGQVFIKKRDLTSNNQNNRKQSVKELDPELIPQFLKFIHGNNNKLRKITDEFTIYMANNGYTVNISKAHLGKNLKQMAQWIKCPEDGPMRNKHCWYVAPEMQEKYNLELTVAK